MILPVTKTIFLIVYQRLGFPQGMNMEWQGGAPPSPSSYIVKKILRLEIPVDAYPNVRLFVPKRDELWYWFQSSSYFVYIAIQFNFVGRLLGPRGNSLKRVEASTGCRVYIRGKGSIKDPGKVTEIFYFLFRWYWFLESNYIFFHSLWQQFK